MFEFRASTPAPDQRSRSNLPRTRALRLGFPRGYRLTRPIEIEKVIREGKRIRTRHLDVRIIASPLGHPRVGIIVPRYSRSIVHRNRLKRRLRELVRTSLLPVLPTGDVVIRVRPDAYVVPFDVLRVNITRTAAQLLRLFQ